jgi:hypothetical protein
MTWYDNPTTFIFYIIVTFFMILLVKYVWDYFD